MKLDIYKKCTGMDDRYIIIERFNTSDGVRSRICNGTFKTQKEAQSQIDKNLSSQDKKMTGIKFEVGKSYRSNRDEKVTIKGVYGDIFLDNSGHYWILGKRFAGNETVELIAEWQDPEVTRVVLECDEFTIGYQPAMKSPASPIETRTTRTIKGGNYGRLCVRTSDDQKGGLNIGMSDGVSFSMHPKSWSLNDIDEAIHTLSQIREVIAENENK